MRMLPLVLLLAQACAGAPEKVRLRFQPVPGDRIAGRMDGTIKSRTADLKVSTDESFSWAERNGALVMTGRSLLGTAGCHLDPQVFSALLPDREVAVGERWAVDSADLNRLWNIHPARIGTGIVVLREIREVDGHRCAVLGVRIDVAEPGSTTSLEGEAVVRIDRGLLRSIALQGAKSEAGVRENLSFQVTWTVTAEKN